MCGFCGIFNERNGIVVTAMLESIQSRGPDSFNTSIFQNHSLGECGLRIVSGKDDVLPLIDKRHEIALLFNGEIYNYRDIKAELIQDGYRFISCSDSEIIIPLYKKYGIKFVERLKGMFAIAIIDRNRIVLIRDRFGIKPIHYAQLGNRLVFGSEIKALLHHPQVPAEIDTESLEEVMVFGYVFSEHRTLLKGINQVPPGTVLRFDGNSISIDAYYKRPAPFYLNNGDGQSCFSVGKAYQDAVEHLRSILVRTFELIHGHGGQEKGVYLSGGVDSTLMAVLSTEIVGKPIQTYTLYDSESAPDFNHARKVASRIGSEHHEFFVTADDYFNELPHFVHHYENLVAGGVFDIQGGVAFQILSEHIGRYHKVALTGEGADELFGGYYWIYTHPLGFSDRIRGRAAQLPEGSRVRDFVEAIFPHPEDETEYRKNLFHILTGSGLSNYHLWSVDRSCGSFGFEARPPFLYDDLAEYALSLPIDFKVPEKSITKKILKDAALPFFRKYRLEEILTRKKYGMPAALDTIGPQIRKQIDNLVTKETIERHPYSSYLRHGIGVLMFDLLYYFLVHRRGVSDTGFSIRDFYKGRINEDMYDQQIPPHPGRSVRKNLLDGPRFC